MHVLVREGLQDPRAYGTSCYRAEEHGRDLEDLSSTDFYLRDEAIARALDGHRRRGPHAECGAPQGDGWRPRSGQRAIRLLLAYFRQHYAHAFPALPQRTTWVRQATQRWRRQARWWPWLLERIPHAPRCALMDRLPVPSCQFARAYRCRLFLHLRHNMTVGVHGETDLAVSENLNRHAMMHSLTEQRRARTSHT